MIEIMERLEKFVLISKRMQLYLQLKMERYLYINSIIIRLLKQLNLHN
jgi:hypothetical protein